MICNDWLEPISNTDLTCSVSLTELLYHVVLLFTLLKETFGDLWSLRPLLKVRQIIFRLISDDVFIFRSENGV